MTVPCRVQHEFGSLEAIKQLVGYRFGVGLIPRITAHQELAQGRLIELPFAHPDLVVCTQIVLQKKKWKNPAIRHLIELLRQAAATDERLRRRF